MMPSSAHAAPAFIRHAAEPVREHLAASQDLGGFLRDAGVLTLDDRRTIVEQALVLFEENYVHLPLKVAMHAVNPIQRIRLLSSRLEQQTSDTMPPEWLFHAELTDIFNSVRDLHTTYQLPKPYAGKVAYLPFMVEECVDDQRTWYFVTHVAQGFFAPGFVPGVEVTHWSGIPIASAVDLNAARYAGSNVAARRSRGVQSLTLRPLVVLLPPFEEWVTISYVDQAGNHLELREPWRVVDNLPPFVDANTISGTAECQGVDFEADEASRAKALLFAPDVVGQQRDAAATRTGGDGGDVPTTMPHMFRARPVQTPAGTFGHIRIFSFATNDPAPFAREFVNLIRKLPQNGLIVDVRDNGGGSIPASESLLGTLTARRITPEPVEFLNTSVNLRICRDHQGDPPFALGPWVASMEQAIETGAVFSNAFPITPPETANSIGQQYYGPVVLITNARCYSATDMFAAGFQDHEIGTVLGVDENTGAGGANVWTQSVLNELATDIPGSPYAPLPGQSGMSVAIRRTLRTGARAGTPVEDLGVIPDLRHRMTRDDVLRDNRDLLARAGEILSRQPTHVFDIADIARQDGAVRVTMETGNVERLDLYLDQRPCSSVDVADGHVEVNIEGAAASESLRIDGFDHGRLVASRTERLPRSGTG